MARLRPVAAVEPSACVHGNIVGLTSILNRGQFFLVSAFVSDCVKRQRHSQKFNSDERTRMKHNAEKTETVYSNTANANRNKT